jgi:predicted DNA-binding protein
MAKTGRPRTIDKSAPADSVVAVRLPEKLASRLRREAERRGLTLSDVVRERLSA